ncbi:MULTISPECIES: BrnT family toxin [unclassified Aureimonas]|uniref:BrnT family toxin n=2 Tax=unclassified Aureimonas TaxID=2615206 RepID=UPI0009E8CA5D
MPRDVADAIDVSDRSAAEFENETRHGGNTKPGKAACRTAKTHRISGCEDLARSTASQRGRVSRNDRVSQECEEPASSLRRPPRFRIYKRLAVEVVVELRGFQWDDGNWPKCAKHGLTREEIEEVFRNGPRMRPDPTASSEERFNAVGTTHEGRHVFVVFTLRGDLIRPISARFMHRKEIARYEQR